MTAAPEATVPMTRVRWVICALLFFATTVNYLDRQLFSLLVPFFENDLRLGPTDLALINVSFLLAYGFGMVFVGRLIDRVGTKKGLGVSFVLWNVASVAHALVSSISGFIGIRFLLGAAEAGNFPAAVRTVTEWFPKRERALATGWFNSGSNFGAILAPLIAVRLAESHGWRTCFLVVGGIGIVWIFFWLRLYRRPEEHPGVSPSELAHIKSDPEEVVETLSCEQVFGMRPVYGIAIAKFFTDAPWWFYLTWLPKFLTDQFRLTPTFMAFAIPVVFIAADVGAIGGGWISSNLLKRGYSVRWARKIALLICASCAVPVMSVGFLVDRPSVAGIPSIYLAVAAVSLAAAAHQGWSSNVYTLISDTLPRGAVATTVGIITTFGVIGSAIFQLFVGRSVQLTGSYLLPFVFAGSLYLVGLLALHLVMPDVELTQPKKRVPMAFIVAGGLALLVAVAGVQWMLNRPPYSSVLAYETERAVDLKVFNAPIVGPTAKVGWMDARWYFWRTPDQGVKTELVKFDRAGRPIIESKGTKAKGYVGPAESDLAKPTSPTPTPGTVLQ